VNVFARLDAGWNRSLDRARRRWPGFDHFWRAKDRYGEVLGGRLAAAIAYYGFFAIFALALVGYAIFGFVLENQEVRRAVVDFLTENLPWIELQNIQDAVNGVQSSGRPIGIVGLIGLGFTGVGWVESIRSSQRAIYGFVQQPGNVVVRWLIDLGMMLLVFVMLAISIGAVDGLKTVVGWLAGGGFREVVSYVLAIVVNMVLAVGLLGVVPRLRISPRRLIGPLLVVGLGLTALNSVGRLYVTRVGTNAAYALIGPVGLLVYLYLFNQVLLWAAAMAATDRRGTVRDLAGGTPATAPADDDSPNGHK